MPYSKTLRVLTNMPWLDGAAVGGRPVEPVHVQYRTMLHQILRLLPLWRYAAVLLNIETRLLYLACLLKKLLPWVDCRLMSVDIILTRPDSRKERLLFGLRRWLLSEVDRFILYYRDTAELRRLYRIPADRVHYVPFKVNTLDHVSGLEPRDEGFFLACGRSNRDYRTLCDAFRSLPFSCTILANWSEIHEHGTAGDGLDCPDNVTLTSDDGTPESWNAWIARARCVVLPIRPGMLSPSGIGTYLVAMALGKPVIITESAATRGLLDDNLAAIVPPLDVNALRSAILRMERDVSYRAGIAAAGRAYALSLGGEDRLRGDIVAQLADLLGFRSGTAISA